MVVRRVWEGRHRMSYIMLLSHADTRVNICKLVFELLNLSLSDLVFELINLMS
jgi:hypothetical protein